MTGGIQGQYYYGHGAAIQSRHRSMVTQSHRGHKQENAGRVDWMHANSELARSEMREILAPRYKSLAGPSTWTAAAVKEDLWDIVHLASMYTEEKRRE